MTGRRKGDAASWRQRFCPRRPLSVWSKRNAGFVAALTTAGRMRPEGLAEVERAKADGRWTRARRIAKSVESRPDGRGPA